LSELVRLYSDLIRIDTSNPGSTEAEAARYVVDTLAAAGISAETVEPEPSRCSVVSRQAGGNNRLPTLLLHGHLDVVPPQSQGWCEDPFGAVEKDGCIWGRGAADMKHFVAMMLLLQRDIALGRVTPRRNLLFAYFADEEMGGGLGSKWIVENRPDLLADAEEAIGEVGGFRVVLPTGKSIYPVQTEEKGLLWVRISVPGEGGHAAFPRGSNAITRLARLVQRLPERQVVSAPPHAFELMMDELKLLLGDGSAETLLAGLGTFGQMALAASRTTFVPTVARAGTKINTIPEEAEVYIDCRFVPGTSDEALALLRNAMDDDMTYEIVASTPGLASPSATPMLATCSDSIQAVDPGAIVVPFALPAGTDAQHLSAVGIQGYGFVPLVLPADFDYPGVFHASNERLPVSALELGYEILKNFISLY
jgi:acetylornithine deacetylase/succinyl-diaminopimelate desuccinylase-like protein